MAAKVRELIAKTKVSVRYEVLAEVIYVLNKVYTLPRTEIVNGINVFLSSPNVETESEEILAKALQTYAEVNMDFVDCILYSLKAVYGHDVFTFDKQLNSEINKLA
ncbi:MAG: PIN domain-containing protein [Oscillospiraceae bacterium]|nr:PIN domain-containing protein [Oscillospiraceae bacterium]